MFWAQLIPSHLLFGLENSPYQLVLTSVGQFKRTFQVLDLIVKCVLAGSLLVVFNPNIFRPWAPHFWHCFANSRTFWPSSKIKSSFMYTLHTPQGWRLYRQNEFLQQIRTWHQHFLLWWIFIIWWIFFQYYYFLKYYPFSQKNLKNPKPCYNRGVLLQYCHFSGKKNHQKLKEKKWFFSPRLDSDFSLVAFF